VPSRNVRKRRVQAQPSHLRTEAYGHLRGDISNRVPRDGNEFALAELLIEPFKLRSGQPKLGTAIVPELLSHELSQERACVLESASNRTKQEQFHPPVPLLDESLLTRVITHQIRFGMKTFKVSADGDRFR
jgi:hypothetical protein